MKKILPFIIIGIIIGILIIIGTIYFAIKNISNTSMQGIHMVGNGQMMNDKNMQGMDTRGTTTQPVVRSHRRNSQQFTSQTNNLIQITKRPSPTKPLTNKGT